MTRKSARSQQERMVVVMGPTGAGKSKFIEYATGSNGNSVGHSWRSHTSDIQTVRAVHPTNGDSVVFVDTPGFDDTFKSDTEILTIVAEWLVGAKKGKVYVATILYLHRISDIRMSGSAMKNLRLFQSICGPNAMLNVAIVTTMWSKVGRKDGIDREEELRQEVWHDMVGDGCGIARFDDTPESAWRIVDNASQTQASANVLLSSEVVDTHLRLNETTVGITLNAELEKLIKDRKNAARKFKGYAKNGDNVLVKKELDEIETKIGEIAEQLQQMKIPFTRRIRLFFKSKGN
ncbi:hypothetical protein PILCRDRAFT_826443 [Piloderma croceum F 1598]|uniref:G domain-containing protein n=1 Tax=Piloderma croceum (strain F 1598) TaxID=765440 RepID=A0A0C3F8P6_PILCF|nr:hypothetical protein PILCRDRAFT_826443 [Piloderma croceum F 1598]